MMGVPVLQISRAFCVIVHVQILCGPLHYPDNGNVNSYSQSVCGGCGKRGGVGGEEGKMWDLRWTRAEAVLR